MYFPELQDDFWQSYYQIWQQEYEFRSQHQEIYLDQDSDPLEGLLEVSDLESVAAQRRQAQLDIGRQQLLNPQLLLADESPASTSNVNSDLVAFRALLDELPPQLSARLVMAGGAVVDYLIGAPQTDNIDLFLVTDAPTEVLQQVLSLWGDRVLSLRRSKTMVSAWVDVAPRLTAQQKLAQVEALLQQPGLTDAEVTQAMRRLMNAHQSRRYVLVKFTLRHWLRPVQVLLDFDLDCCRCLYYQGKFYATGSCLLALRHSLNVVDLSRAGSTYNQRLRKYARRGFHVLIQPRMVAITAVHLRAALVPGLTSRVGWDFEGQLVGLLALFFTAQGPSASPPQSTPPQLTGYSVECQQGKIISYSYPVANYGLEPLLERPSVITKLYSSLKWGPSPRLEFRSWGRCGYAIKRWIKLPCF